MLKTLGFVAVVLGVSSCGHSAGKHPADGGASERSPMGGGTEGGANLGPSNLTDGGAQPEVTVAPGGGVFSVRFTVSYGECAGFCVHSLLVSASGATLRSTTNSPSSHAVEETLTLDPGVTGRILDAADGTLGSAWESRYGCPDCADQGAYHLEVAANGTVRETILDPLEHPALFDPLIAAIQPVLSAHPGPSSICAMDPAHCTPGKVSLVLGLDEDGALEPTWYNDLDHSVFLAGCTTVTFEKVEGDAVTWSGTAAQCVWEGNARHLGFTDLLTDFALGTKDKTGTYRATGSYYEGCTAGKPISQAACTNQTPVTSNSITLTK